MCLDSSSRDLIPRILLHQRDGFNAACNVNAIFPGLQALGSKNNAYRAAVADMNGALMGHNITTSRLRGQRYAAC